MERRGNAAGGYGLLLSLNYERMLPGPVALQGGITEWEVCNWVGDWQHTTAVPLGVSYLIGGIPALLGGTPSQWVEIGTGAVVSRKGEGDNDGTRTNQSGFVSLAATVGLRHQPTGRGIMYRIAFTPLLTFGGKEGFADQGLMPFAGISVGYAF